jgi:5-methylcytosine-specific restriction endonuclease McrA
VASVPPPSLSEAPPLSLTGQQDESGPANSHEFYPPQVFTGTPISQPTSTPTMDTLDGGAEPLPSTRYFPPGKRLAKKKALTVDAELSIFDIYNIFRRRWFLSVDHLKANALSAQKAEDGKISWVEFTPQFHTHLVKCAVALVPRPIKKVKQVMFGFILELLNREGPTAFFDLTKGQRHQTRAQKEKKRLARKRNHASRRERRKAAEEAAKGRPQRQCQQCGRKFASRKAAKRHRCPLSKEASRKGGEGKGKGKADAPPKPNKPAPNTATAPSASLTPPA